MSALNIEGVVQDKVFIDSVDQDEIYIDGTLAFALEQLEPRPWLMRLYDGIGRYVTIPDIETLNRWTCGFSGGCPCHWREPESGLYLRWCGEWGGWGNIISFEDWGGIQISTHPRWAANESLGSITHIALGDRAATMYGIRGFGGIDLDISRLRANQLILSSTGLRELDLSNRKNLELIDVAHNWNLASLNLRGLTELRQVNVWGTQIGVLDFRDSQIHTALTRSNLGNFGINQRLGRIYLPRTMMSGNIIFNGVRAGASSSAILNVSRARGSTATVQVAAGVNMNVNIIYSEYD